MVSGQVHLCSNRLSMVPWIWGRLTWVVIGKCSPLDGRKAHLHVAGLEQFLGYVSEFLRESKQLAPVINTRHIIYVFLVSQSFIINKFNQYLIYLTQSELWPEDGWGNLSVRGQLKQQHFNIWAFSFFVQRLLPHVLHISPRGLSRGIISWAHLFPHFSW